jgi:putative ABC transport system permease protein
MLYGISIASGSEILTHRIIMTSFFKLFFRVLRQSRVFSVLNIAGLSVGMASFIIIVLWIVDELSYDKFNENADRIVRVVSHFKLNGKEGHAIYCPAPLANAVKKDFPEVENVVRLRGQGNFIVQKGDLVFDEDRIIFADSTFFNVFTYPLIYGDPDKVLTARTSLAISESTAMKYFGDENPVGQLLRLDNRTDYEVTGVFKDMPVSSHFHYDFIASMHTLEDAGNELWLSNNYTTYILLSKGVGMATLDEKMNQIVEKYISVQAVMALGMSWEDILASGTSLGYTLQKLTDIHLYSNFDGELEPPGSINTVRIFGIIAAFIILIACINFTNLSTARSVTRLKEVGVRKTYGVSRKQLIKQFNTESLLIVILAHILSLVLIELSLPYFNDLTGKSLFVDYLSAGYVFSALGMIVIVSLLAGAYPSFYLSSFRPIHVLRGDPKGKGTGLSFRSILVIIQFFISLVLLSSTLILAKQMRYMQSKELGYDKDAVIVINNTYLMQNNVSTFQERVDRLASIENSTISSFLPIPSNRNNSSVFPDAILTENLFNCQNWVIDHNYIETFGLRIAEGRNFSEDYPTDSLALILNQTAVKELGWDEPIGRIIGVPATYDGLQEMDLDAYTVIGVVEDFHYESMHLPVESMIMFLGSSRSRLTIRIQQNTDIISLMKDVENIWNEFVPGQPFSYTFVDQRLEQHYETERRLGKILSIFTVFAFFVSSLGLIGLSIFSSEQRKKEIGLRKVNGSGIGQIIWLLSTDFTKLIVVSFVLSVPFTVIFMQKWLNTFAYRTPISWWIFALTFFLTYAVALIAIIYQSLKAATSNPVDTFRTE